MFRSGGQSEARPPVFKSPSKQVLIYRPMQWHWHTNVSYEFVTMATRLPRSCLKIEINVLETTSSCCKALGTLEFYPTPGAARVAGVYVTPLVQVLSITWGSSIIATANMVVSTSLVLNPTPNHLSYFQMKSSHVFTSPTKCSEANEVLLIKHSSSLSVAISHEY
ncbi:hypothetical protein TNCV_2479401 [Trichonephila clavipes]|nr:hypothetical protein TNCV_2479401 [Trichonephila clavipes]